jgi:hypothetical protein
MSDELRYPTWRFAFDASGSSEVRARALAALAAFPSELRAVATSLTDTQLATPYREGGWTARQVVHHVADSHSNAAIRMRWLLTEDRPTLKAYDEKGWAELPDAALAPLEPSLTLIDGLHARMQALLTQIAPADFSREIVHPDRGPMSLDMLVQMYAWHGRHHLGHLHLVQAKA